MLMISFLLRINIILSCIYPFFPPSSTSCIVNITFVALLYCFLLLSFLFMLFLFSHVILPCLWLSVFCNVKTGGVPVQNMPVRDSFYLPVQTPYSEWFLGQSKYKQVELQLKRNRTSRRISSVSLLIRQSLSLHSRLCQEDKRFLSEGNAHPINLHCVGSWVIHRLLAPYRARFSYVKHTHTHHKHFLIDGLMHFFQD